MSGATAVGPQQHPAHFEPRLQCHRRRQQPAGALLPCVSARARCRSELHGMPGCQRAAAPLTHASTLAFPAFFLRARGPLSPTPRVVSPCAQNSPRAHPTATRTTSSYFSIRTPLADIRISTRSSPRAALDASACWSVSCALCARAPRFSGLPAAISAVRYDTVALSVCALSVSVCVSEHGSEVRSPV